MKKQFIYLFFLLGSISPLSAQQRIIDSLKNLLKTDKEDTNKVNHLNTLSDKLAIGSNNDSSIAYGEKGEALAQKIGFKKGEADALISIGYASYNKSNYSKAEEFTIKAMNIYQEIGNKDGIAVGLAHIGIFYRHKGDYPKALDYFFKALKIKQEIGDKRGTAVDFGNIGIVYYSQGNYPNALDYYFKALKIYEEIKDNRGIATNLSNIGGLYVDQGNNQKALEYMLKAADVFQEMGSMNASANNLCNIGVVYDNMGNYAKALEYDFKALALNQKMGNKDGMAVVFGNIGSVYKEQGNYSQALDYDHKALVLAQGIGYKRVVANSYLDISSIYNKQKNYKETKTYLDSALVLSKDIGEKELITGTYKGLAELDSSLGNYKSGWEYYKLYIINRDSLLNDANTKKSIQTELNYEFTRKTDSTKAAQDILNAVADKENQRQKVIRNSFMTGFALMIVLAFFIFRGYRQKQKSNVIISQQKVEVEKQKELIEEKNKDILASITYAKRLQDAILPPLSLIKQLLPESFLLYKPKDIVAGDFYWMERAGDNILIAAADCTGHGVPGALVSVVCSNALNRTVKEFHITEPGKILDKVRELLLETFEKSESNIQDGMDISLCCINTKTNEMQWSGAYNSLWYIHNGEIKEVPADKQPIGKYDKLVPFNTHNLNLQKGDTLYLFTDGYADQFGGPKGKKFKYKQLEGLLLANADKPMEEQKRILNETFEQWKGELEQVDDILIIGIEV